MARGLNLNKYWPFDTIFTGLAGNWLYQVFFPFSSTNKFYVTTFYQDQCPMTMAPMCLPGLQSWEVPRKQTSFAFCIKSSPSASTLWKGQQSLIFITVLKSFPKKLKAAYQRQSMSCQSKYVCRLHHECTPDYVRTYHAWPSAKWPSPQCVSFLYLRWMLREWNYVRG